jgi:cell division protein FtsL
MLKVLKKLTKNRSAIFLLFLVLALVVLALGTKMYSSSKELFLTEEEVAEKVKNANLKVNSLEEQVKELQTEFSSHYHETKTPDIKT